MRAPILRTFLLALAAAAAAARLHASTARIWLSDTASEFSTGEARGVSVTGDGALVLARGLQPVSGIAEAAIFTAARGPDGVLYLGTGDAGKILRIPDSNRAETLVTLPEKEVTALAVGPDGALYAGASPGGKIYRIQKGEASPYYETGARYVWALAFAGPTLWIGTGLPGEIHRVARASRGERVPATSRGERVHTTTNPHVRSLFADATGRLWAGTSGSGLVLRIEKTGTITTVYDSARTEISSIVGSADGRIWASAVSAEVPPGGGEAISAATTLPAPRSSQPAESRLDGDGGDKAEVSVTVSSPRLAASRSSSKGNYSSEILLFEEGEPARVAWSSSEELVFDLGRDEEKGSVLAATGPNGKLYRISPQAWSLERTLEAKQVSALAGDALATNGASGAYRLAPGPREGEYVSAVKDTGRTSRFGTFRWEGSAPSGTRVEFAFRSGESALPDTTWSAWSSYETASAGATVPSPAGRFLQWRVRMQSDSDRSPAVRRVEAAYRNRNAAPLIESLTVLPPAEVLARAASGSANVFETSSPDEKGIFTSLEEPKAEGAPKKLLRKGYRTLTWRGTDPDGDPLTFALELRPAASQRWIPLREGIRDTFFAFDTTSLPDGEYVVRLLASDEEANPEETKSASRESSPVSVDNTPPAIHGKADSKGAFEFEVVDAASPLLEAEYSVDAKEWRRLEPLDGMSDSTAESYRIPLAGLPRGGYLLLRVTDSSRNVAASSASIP